MMSFLTRQAITALRRSCSQFNHHMDVAGPSKLGRLPRPPISHVPARQSSSITSRGPSSASHRPYTPSLPAMSASPLLRQIRGLKVRSAVRKMCDNCQIVRRKGVVRVICKSNPKHKQRQG